MNRYRDLMDAVEPAEGFKDRLSENVLSHTPSTRRPYRPITAIQTLLLIICITLALAITAGAAYIVLNWDPIFVRRFSPAASQASQLGDASNEQALSQCGDVTLKVRQTLGDDKTIFIILDITLPSSTPLQELIVKNPSGDTNHDILPKDVWVCPVTASYRDIEGKSFREACRSLAGLSEGSCSISNDSVDFSTNTLTFLISCTPQSGTVSGKPLTILLGGFQQMTEQGMRTILDGPYLISWTPAYSPVPTHTYDIRDGGQTIGSVTISPFALKGAISRFDYETAEDFYHSVSLTFRDGTTYLPELKSIIGGYSRTPGSADFEMQFTSLLTPEIVTAIQVGGYTVKTN